MNSLQLVHLGGFVKIMQEMIIPIKGSLFNKSYLFCEVIELWKYSLGEAYKFMKILQIL